MCDCACKCWQIPPVRQRITNTYIHADIFGQGSTLNVKCEPKQGETHICKCENVWQKPVVKDTRHRPLDHPNEYFYSQDVDGCQCCESNVSQGKGENQKEEKVDKTVTFGKGAQSLYYFQELPPAGKYDGPSKPYKNGNSKPFYKGIHTGQTENYDRHECNRDVWFNDAKERQIDRMNDNLGRGYSANRKRLEMNSNAFDFIDDTGENCQCTQTAKFQTTRFENDCSPYLSANRNIARENFQKVGKPSYCSGRRIEHRNQIKQKKVQIKQSPAGKCTSACQCWKVLK